MNYICILLLHLQPADMWDIYQSSPLDISSQKPSQKEPQRNLSRNFNHGKSCLFKEHKKMKHMVLM